MRAVDLPVDEQLLNFRYFEVQGIWVECTECFPHGVSPILAESALSPCLATSPAGTALSQAQLRARACPAPHGGE